MLYINVAGGAGFVGIGNPIPAYTLDVSGDINISGTYRVAGTAIGTGTGTVTSITAGTGVTMSPSSPITTTGTISIGQAVATTSAVTFASLTATSAANTTGITLSNGNISVGSAAATAVASISVAYQQGMILPGSSGSGLNGIYGMNTDGASNTLSNMQLRSWFGIGFGPSITGQTIPINENAVWMNVRTGDMTARGSLAVGTAATGTAGTILASGEITAYSSDSRLKLNVTKIDGALYKLSLINGVMFDWNVAKAETLGFNPAYTHDVGVIAQEIEAILPEAVRPAPFDRNEDGSSKSGDGYLTVQYEKLTALLIEAVKELKSEVDALKARLDGQ